jgi:hypothetical protein
VNGSGLCPEVGVGVGGDKVRRHGERGGRQRPTARVEKEEERKQ